MRLLRASRKPPSSAGFSLRTTPVLRRVEIPAPDPAFGAGGVQFFDQIGLTRVARIITSASGFYAADRTFPDVSPKLVIES